MSQTRQEFITIPVTVRIGDDRHVLDEITLNTKQLIEKLGPNLGTDFIDLLFSGGLEFSLGRFPEYQSQEWPTLF